MLTDCQQDDKNKKLIPSIVLQDETLVLIP